MKPAAQARRQPPGAAGATAKAQTGRRSLTTLTDGPESAQEPVRGTGSQDGLLVALPWPPSVNHYYRHIVVRGQARVVISADGRRYAQAVGLRLVGLRDRVPSPPHEVRVALHAPTRAKLDIDNRAKALLDALYRALGLDDVVIDRLVIERGPMLSGGRALVLIKALEPAPGTEGE
jgi:crossover junction endodeoxyribonuclease RusA